VADQFGLAMKWRDMIRLHIVPVSWRSIGESSRPLATASGQAEPHTPSNDE
jgi:hypothetical protein